MSSMMNHKKRSHRSEKARRTTMAGMTRFAPKTERKPLAEALYRPGRHRRGREKPRKACALAAVREAV